MDITIDKLPMAVDAASTAVNVSADLPDPAFLAVAIGGAGLILFVLFVLPVWLLLHYRARTKRLEPPPAPVAPVAVAAARTEDLAELLRLAERLEHRLDAMESLMDAERPRWRN